MWELDDWFENDSSYKNHRPVREASNCVSLQGKSWDFLGGGWREEVASCWWLVARAAEEIAAEPRTSNELRVTGGW